MVIRIVLRPRTVAHTRFVVSPLFELSTLLLTIAKARAGTPPHGTRIRRYVERAHRAMADRRLAVLDALATPPYLPDFLWPHPEDAEPDLAVALRQVAEASAQRVRAEMEIVVHGRPVANLAGHPLAAVLTDALANGEPAFARQVADELRQLWRAVLATEWNAVRRELEADVQRRAGVLARRGVAGLLGSLNSQISWHDDEVHVASPYEVTVTWGDALLLAPTATADRVGMLVDPVSEPSRRPPMLVYPIETEEKPAVEPAGDSLLGVTRNALLTDLAAARTTTELARRHHLTPSAVSYHLSILHRSGMVSRSRIGSGVYYQRTEHGEAVLSAIGSGTGK
ncbi:ArsR family transcriptional regulator [Fodinicola acaciae]|uniref:ArsR family transcriptional regulator n=1 Tax=Fodinicola acaciae TaxID=2681555 RepID=UPI0013D07AA0|nr:ArsR family transcriptional regulator [Fodinicola acaciae]